MTEINGNIFVGLFFRNILDCGPSFKRIYFEPLFKVFFLLVSVLII